MPIVPDVLDENLKMIICGSALGNVSAAQKAYYAHPSNRFWKNLYIAGFTDRQLAPQEYPQLLAYGIGMTDLCKEESGLDAQLSKDAYDETRLLQLIQKYQPRYLVFSGLRPARAFLRGCFDVPVNKVQAGLQPQQIGKTKIFATTSSSPLYPDQERTLALWHMLYQQMLETSSVPTP